MTALTTGARAARGDRIRGYYSLAAAVTNPRCFFMTGKGDGTRMFHLQTAELGRKPKIGAHDIASPARRGVSRGYRKRLTVCLFPAVAEPSNFLPGAGEDVDWAFHHQLPELPDMKLFSSQKTALPAG